MILPASYANGFAPRDGSPLYPSLWKGCVGAWNPGLGVSGLTLRDASGFKNNGTLTNGPTWGIASGRQALSFDGTNDYVLVSHNTAYNTTAITISAWVMVRNYPAIAAQIVSKGNVDGVSFPFEFDLGSAGKPRFYQSQSGGLATAIVAAIAISKNVWHHVVAVNNTNVASIFVDGIQDGTDATPATSATVETTAIGIGSDGTGSHYFLDGNICDVRIYNRGLSTQEIRLLAIRAGIAYEMAPRRRSSSAVPVTTYSTFRPSVLRGSR